MHTLTAPTILKQCRYCGQSRPEESFEVCRVVKGKAYRRLRCQLCKYRYATQRRASIRRWVDELKKTMRCATCGFADFRALEFHHPDGEDKGFNIADMVKNGLSIDSLKREIAKCVTLCANCHHIAHYEERTQRAGE